MSYKKLAFCFLIYDVINQEELWHDFLCNVDKSKYNIYIHYKTQKELKYFEQYKLNNCIETKWGDISLVHAQNLLLKRALEDHNTHYIFVSQACIPVKSFDFIYNFLDLSYSYFNMTPASECFPRCTNLLKLKYFPKNHIQKASQWCILKQSHAELMINYDNDHSIKKIFGSIGIPDEIAYITLIYHHNLQNELITTPNTAISSTTASQWPNQIGWKVFNNSKYAHKVPKTYIEISEEEINYLCNQSCLFARKFEVGSISDKIADILKSKYQANCMESVN